MLELICYVMAGNRKNEDESSHISNIMNSSHLQHLCLQYHKFASTGKYLFNQIYLYFVILLAKY